MTSQKGGIYALNRGAYEALGSPEAVELLYARDERIVGFRPTTKDNSHGYRTRKQVNGSAWLVSGRSFCRYYGIPIDETHRYPARLVDGMLTIKLKDGGGTKSSRAKGQGASDSSHTHPPATSSR